jgi:hypothetical protein
LVCSSTTGEVLVSSVMPALTVGADFQLFWGDDRLGDAARSARGGA